MRDEDLKKRIITADINYELRLVIAGFWQEVLVALCDASKKPVVGLASEMIKWPFLIFGYFNFNSVIYFLILF